MSILGFSYQIHPSLIEAGKRIKYLSSRDRREIRRMTKLMRDEDVFGESSRPMTSALPNFAQMWAEYLARKGPDVAIVFA